MPARGWWLAAIALPAVVSAAPAGEAEPFGLFDYLGAMVEDGDGEYVDALAMAALDDEPLADEPEHGGDEVWAAEDENDE